jgi:undecaprenyl pyrophosphate synthase
VEATFDVVAYGEERLPREEMRVTIRIIGHRTRLCKELQKVIELTADISANVDRLGEL